MCLETASRATVRRITPPGVGVLNDSNPAGGRRGLTFALRPPCQQMMHSLLVSALLALPAAAQSCTSAFSQTDYGVLAAAGAPQAFCTNVPPSRYANNALQLSRHQAPPGHRLVLTITAWDTESGYDFATVYAAAAGAAVAASAVAGSASCALAGASGTLAKASGAGPPSFGPYFSGYGAQLGVCLYSDSNTRGGGIVYNLTAEACPAGFFCATNADSAENCPPGTYSTAGSLNCTHTATSCPAGTFARSPASCRPCAAGFFSSSGASFCSACAPGAFGIAGASTCAFSATSCPAGTFASAPASCLPCAAGRYGASLNNTGSSCDGPCGAGGYCPQGSSSPSQISCPSGFVCPVGSGDPQRCPTGSFPAPDATHCTSCLVLAKGEIDYGVLSPSSPAAFCTNAPPSFHASNALQLSQHQAPPGYRLVLSFLAWDLTWTVGFATVFSAAAGSSVSTAASCITNGTTGALVPLSDEAPPSFGPYYSNFGGVAGLCFASEDDSSVIFYLNLGIVYWLAAEACPAGSFCATNAPAAVPCEAGSYSTAGSTMCSYTANSCPSGTFASVPASCLPCAPGSFSRQGAGACSSCPPGTFSVAGASSCANACPSGTFASAPASCLRCSEGSFSLSGDSSCTSCAAGTYQPRKGQSSCEPCAAGKHGAAAGATSPAACAPCAAGTFSPRSGSLACSPCPNGTYSEPGASFCFYTAASCPAGTFSSHPASCLPCPQGTYNEYPGQVSLASCIPCFAGQMNPVAGASNPTACMNCPYVRFPRRHLRRGSANCAPFSFPLPSP